MARLSRSVSLLPAMLLLGATPAMAERVGVMVLDASGSMWNRMEGDITRIEVARDVIDEYLQDRDPEVPLSVLAYGHNRRGDCGDIEVIAAMELQDADTLADQIRALNPQGMTPIADSLRLAAEQIPRPAEAADIILVTDGLETCDGDPCAEAARLAEQGLAIRAHVVGFGLTDSEVQQLSCVTEQTGGELFQTNSGAELASALSQVEQAAAEPAPEPEPEPEPAPPPAAELTAPDEAPAGSVIEVAWTGPDDDRDYVTIVEAGAPAGSYLDYTRTSRGSPLTITAPDALGNHEIRYVHQQSGETLASHPITLTPVEASLSAPEEVVTGSQIEVEWQGPDNPRDYVTIVEAGAPEGSYLDYTRTSRGSPLTITAPDALGNHEIRYVLQQSGRTLASHPINLIPASADVTAPEEAVAGSVIEIEWEGPDNPRDYITIVEAGAPEGSYLDYTRTSRGSPLTITAPDALGNHEIRYVLQQSGRTLASQPITLIPASASVTAPEEAVAGSVIEVEWEGPDNPRDYITIVEAGAPEGSYLDYTRTSRGSPLTITAPDALGNHEIRYVLQQSGRTLASQPISLVPATAQLMVNEPIVPSGEFQVEWVGPDNPRDYITIVEAGAPEGSHTDYVRTSRGSPVTLDAPTEPGDYEVRYVIQQSGRTLASEPVSVGAGEVSLAIEGTPEAGGVVTINWQGPGRYEDYIQIVEAGSAADADAIREARASQGSPVQLFAPSSAGDYEVRYKASDSGEVLERISFSLE
ncbi:vWA domain-containing protein [Halomonas lysinitropha]|uniref:von Willebrand factor type A domain protein n=1 Tax=Halomonas lysinitropha TaxID=2607506 RepID=A0A5K1I4E6_9GAMM|nr:VWA domain-containing protein [Halomonas lysinitropha]VVZ96316.1 von Willebrand factor type A domain protein [Halomonas lysinitropha]